VKGVVREGKEDKGEQQKAGWKGNDKVLWAAGE
jgi:hypothetical protein